MSWFITNDGAYVDGLGVYHGPNDTSDRESNNFENEHFPRDAVMRRKDNGK